MVAQQGLLVATLNVKPIRNGWKLTTNKSKSNEEKIENIEITFINKGKEQYGSNRN